MEILETTTIYFEGSSATYHSGTTPFYMRNDAGERFFINIPNIDEVTVAFKWMNESNILRYLIELEPKFTTNENEIQAIVDSNARTFEIASATGKVQTNNIIMNPQSWSYQPITTWPGAHTVPEFTWRAEWTFWQTEYAVLLKLALPGAKCDTMK